MTIQTLARTIVTTVLDVLDRHTFAAIPAPEIQQAVDAVADLLREESAALVEPEEEEQ